MKVKVATIFYDYNKDAATIKMSDEYKGWDGVLKADVMQDAIYLAAKEYDEALLCFRDEFDKIRAKHVKKRV